MNFSYKLIFTFFGISVILPSSLRSVENSRWTISVCFVFLVNALIMMFFVYGKVYRIHFIQYLNTPYALVSSEVILNTIVFMHRFFLCRKLNELKRIARIMSSLRIKEEGVLCLYTWIAFSTMGYVLRFIALVDTNDKNMFISKLFCISNNNSALHKVAVISYAFNSAILMELPLNTFAAFFVIVNLDMKCVLKNFSKVMCSETVENYRKLLSSFNSLKTTIDLLDDGLSFFVLCEILYSSDLLFFTITLILRDGQVYGQSPTSLRGISFVYQLVTILGTFVIITISACSVSEAYAKVWTKLKTIIVNSELNFALRQQNCFLCIEKEAHFTLWKIMPINRSFILVTLGAIITYVLLFDNLIYIKAK